MHSAFLLLNLALLGNAIALPLHAQPTLYAQAEENVDVPLLVNSAANFVRGDRYQTQSQMQVNATCRGVSTAVKADLNVTAQYPDRIRAEVTIQKEDGTPDFPLLVVVQGDKVWEYRSDRQQYAALSLEAFKQSGHGDLTLAEVQQDIIESQHTRILVIEDSIDRVIGVALKDELLAAIIEKKEDSTLANLTRKVRFVPETVRADKLLKEFQESREHLMVVLDEYGGVSGVVTLEDVLEILTGEIVDETDRIIDLQAVARKKRERLLQARGFGHFDST